ncbi:MAG TPA: cytochrome c oxidase subunit II [Sphingomonadaceae bacterium]|nr:cytochrome c oxidase subunit II [Sphingomonadaceae bacterium]
MNFGETLRTTVTSLRALSLGLLGSAPFALLPKAALAQEAAAAAATPAAEASAAAPAYIPLGPDMIKGQPEPGGFWLQKQYSPIGHDASWMHDYVLTPVIIGIVVLVLLLLLFVMVRFNRRANPVPSKTSHNTLLEVLWTGVPILILVLIAVPSLNLLAEQYKSAPKDALTVKVTGYQWYWGYSYPDNGGFEVISNMMPEEEAKAKGLPTHLEVDHRMVVPVGVPIRLQTTAADVIHSFAVPSLWFKLDAVPGRLNEKVLQIDEPGIYYGQCSELCGVRHGYMPIAVEAVSQEKFEQWLLSQGGEIAGKKEAAAPAAVTPVAATPTVAETAAPGAA